MSGARAIAVRCAVGLLAVTGAREAAAFPPYRSTDAETADPWTLEARLGLLRWRREGTADVYSSPLLRLNFGFPCRIEIVTELEHEAGEGLVDGAVGLKWVPLMGAASVGIETLALLPVSGGGGLGIESNLVMTYRRQAAALHVNAGAFYDARPVEAERGWRAGILAEWRVGRFRPGFEVFAKRAGAEPVQILAGPGVIIGARRMDVRLGLHFGLTAVAPDVVTDVWGAGKLKVR